MHERREEQLARRLSASLALVLAAGIVGAADLRDFSKRFGQNQKELRAYRWKSRVEMVLNGRSESVRVFDVRRGSDGSLAKTPLPGAKGAKKPSKKQRRLEALGTDLQALIDSYLEPDERTADRYFDQAAVWQGPGRIEGETRLKARNVRRQGDEVSLWLDAETGVPHDLLIVTSAEGEPVRVMTEFVSLEDGPFYPASVVVETEIKEKKLVVKTENFDFSR
jgi:hypothetical protein